MSDLALALGKTPPSNVEAEQAVLGAILLDKSSLDKALEIIDAEDFYQWSHKAIFTSMVDLSERNEPVDLVTVTNHLRGKGLIEKVGGASYVSSLSNQAYTSANVKYHAKIIREKSLLRSLIESANQITARVLEGEGDAEEAVDYAEKVIFEISDKRISVSFAPLKSLLGDTFRTIEELYERKFAITGVPSGFKDLDELTTGFQPGDLIVIGGRPSMGKTAFGLNVAQHVALNAKMPVAVFSLEMSKKQLAIRMLCSEAMVDSNKIRKGFISKEDWPRLTGAAGRLGEAPIFIDDSSSTSVLEMRAKARRLKKEHGLGLVLIDYLQLMRGRGSFERREQEISDISRSLKALAKELEVPVIALSQLNRGVELRKPPIPNLADLRESGAIEQDADVILFIYRDEFYNRERSDKKGVADIFIAKQRNGPTGIVELAFLASCTKFADKADRYYEIEEED